MIRTAHAIRTEQHRIMKTYIDLLLVAAITIYIVDLSGFTQSWRSALARILKARDLKPMKPFDCSACMTWWVGIIYALCIRSLSLPVLAFVALLSYLSIPIGQILIFIKEGACFLLNKMMRWYE